MFHDHCCCRFLRGWQLQIQETIVLENSQKKAQLIRKQIRSGTWKRLPLRRSYSNRCPLAAFLWYWGWRAVIDFQCSVIKNGGFLLASSVLILKIMGADWPWAFWYWKCWVLIGCGHFNILLCDGSAGGKKKERVDLCRQIITFYVHCAHSYPLFFLLFVFWLIFFFLNDSHLGEAILLDSVYANAAKFYKSTSSKARAEKSAK